MIDGLAPLRHEIEGPYERYRVARCELFRAIRTAQADCPHLQVLHTEGFPTPGAAPTPPLRMCACCRLEEEGTLMSSRVSWTPRGSREAKPVLGNEPARLVVEAEREEIYRLRLPGGRCLVGEQRKEFKFTC